MKAFLWLPLLMISTLNAAGQQGSSINLTGELKFYEYLLEKNLLNDAALQYKNIIGSENLTESQSDSLHFLTGWNLYQTKQLDSSVFHLMMVGKSSKQYLKSRFFSAYNKSYLHEFDSALYILNSIEEQANDYTALLNLERAGLALLKNDFVGFKSNAGNFDGHYYATANEEQQLKGFYERLGRQRKKSPLKAGVLSAIVPGLGKVYAGRIGEGVIGFVQVGALGLITAESYNKSGVNSGRFIVAATIFSLFYIGNIWGSYFSIRIEEKEKRNEIYNAILFNMHIPLRTVFN